MLRSGPVAWSGEAVKPRVTHGLLDAVSGHPPRLLHPGRRRLVGHLRSLNCGVGSHDDKGFVFKNRARAARTLGVAARPSRDALSGPRRRRGHRRQGLGARAGPEGRRGGHRRRGVAVGIGTADCGPILFADPAAHVVGAAHAGWRGALGGILESTIAAMEEARRRAASASSPSSAR